MNRNTAIGADNSTHEEIVKVRLQSTPEEISNFEKMLNRCEELGLCEVVNFSSLFRNKGTNKYFRAYSDVKIKEADHE